MGLIHIYCGDGKGKTTASLGLAMRSAGAGKRVHFVQLLKGTDTSELNTLKLIPNITVDRCQEDYGFTFGMNEEDKSKITNCHNDILNNSLILALNNDIDVLIIDEFNAAYEYGLIDRELADKIVLNKPEQLELIITGRNPDKKFIDIADYISEIKAIKHPYQNGIVAREGIEY